MVCPVCSTENVGNGSSCSSCGSNLDAAATLPGDAIDATLNWSPAQPNSSADSPTIGVPARPSPDALTLASVAVSGAGAAARMSPIGGRNANLEPGQDFGPRYQLGEMLGRGGMGAVYRAYDKELDRYVALKVIKPELLDNPNASQRFKQELLLSSKVTHRNVLRIHDLGEVEGTKFISMALVEGQDLSHPLRDRQPLPLSRALRIARELCAALDAAHAEGVVHRDLKPQNILLGKNDHVYVSDFGLAKSVGQDDAGMTRTGEFLGTPRYMAPEQVEGIEVDHRADLYALGLILYEMTTGDVPFTGNSAMQVMFARTKHAPKSPKELNPELPDYVVGIILRCLEKDPDARYQHAREVLADIDAQAPPSVTASRMSSFATSVVVPPQPKPRRRVWLAGAALALALVAVVGGWYWKFQRTAPPAASVEPAVSLAIVPFHNASNDPSLDWLGTSLAEMLRADMGAASQLRVVATDRVYQTLRDLRVPSGTELDAATLRRVAEFTSADQLLSGQYVKVGNLIRIDARLQDLKRQQTVTLKAEAADEKALLGAVESLARSVQQNLALSADVVTQLRASSLRPSTTSVQALREYTEGLQLARQGNSQEALKRFLAATQQDSQFALAYAKAAEAYAAMKYDDKADESARRAVQLSESLPAQQKYLIDAIYARVTQNSDKAIAAYENLAKVLPDDPEVQIALARLYEDMRVLDKAAVYYEKLLAADPKHTEALMGLGRVQIFRGNPQASLDYLNRALSVAVQLENDGQKAAALLYTGTAYGLLNKPNDALRNLQEALELRRRRGDKGGTAQALNSMAQMHDVLGQSDQAFKKYQEALAIRREIGDKRGTANTLLDLGKLYESRGQYDLALSVTKESLQIHREAGDIKNQAGALNNIGAMYFYKGDYENALTYYQQALDLQGKLNSPAGMADTLYNLAETATKLGQYEQAVNHYLKAVEIWRNADDKRGLALGSYGMAKLFEYQGRYGAALSAAEDALKNIRAAKEQGLWLAQIEGARAAALARVGHTNDAREGFEHAFTAAAETRNDSLTAQLFNAQGQGLLYQGDVKSARAALQRAAQAARRSKDRDAEALAALNLAKVAIQEGRASTVLGELRKLAETSDRAGMKFASVDATTTLAEALVASGDYARARAEIDRALRASDRLGLRELAARNHYLMGAVLRHAGSPAESAQHYREARRILDDIRKESRSEDVLKRSDLAQMYAESARWSEPPNS